MHVPLELKSTNVADLNRQFKISGPIRILYPQKDSERNNAPILTRRSLWKCLCTDVQMYPRGEPSCHRHRKQRDDHLVKTWQGQIKWQWEKSHFMWQNRKGYTHSLIPRTAHPVGVPVERIKEFLPFDTPHFHRLVIWSRDQPLAIAGEMNASNARCVSFEHSRLTLSVTHIDNNASRYK